MKKQTLIAIMIMMLVPLVLSAQEIKGRFAIQNIQTGKNLRPYEAGSADGNRIVLYNHVEWKCMTWDFILVKDATYQLKNRFTGKTFQPSAKPADGVNLIQKPLAKDSLQYWIFEKQADNSYFIRLKGTGLYISLSGKDTNSDIVLKPKKDKLMQSWKLVAQDPSM